MRGAALGVAVAVLAAACGVVPLPGGRQLVADVTNTEAFPVLLTIETPNGVQGAVQPASLPARGRGMVTFFLPPGDDWWINVNGSNMFPASDVNDISESCVGGKLSMEVSANGSGGIGCGG